MVFRCCFGGEVDNLKSLSLFVVVMFSGFFGFVV